MSCRKKEETKKEVMKPGVDKLGLTQRKTCTTKTVRVRPKRLCVKQSLEEKEANRLKQVPSRELHAGVVLGDCDCYRRNGLQHDCPRDRCGGKACFTTPWPKCDFGVYYRKKWERYDAIRSRPRERPYCVPFEYDLTRRYVDE